MLATLNGTAIVARVADAVLATSAHPVVIVTGHEAVAVEAALSGRDVTFAHNPRFAEGLSTSLRQGLTTLEEMNFPADGVLVCLGDTFEAVIHFFVVDLRNHPGERDFR